MLASTRDTVTDLNRRARAHRLTTTHDPVGQGTEVGLVDANWASVGDVIITRLNDRHLAISATDWVKNGDRWIVQHVTDRGVVRARHCDTGLTVTLPQDYVAKYVQLGYAVTVHAAQGLTVDVTRGVLTGAETRQQLYVMATRGRHANHLYVPVVGDGDEHSLVHPTTLRPETALDILQTVLARDGAARSATTETREQTAPAIRLTHAAARYGDALHVAAETTVDPDTVTALDQQADQMVEGLTACAAWPALRATLILNAVDGRNPLSELRTAAAEHELESAHDPADVLTWRIHAQQSIGPLPWLPPIPATLTAHSSWGPYLNARAGLVQTFAAAVREAAGRQGTPGWLMPGQHLAPDLIEEVEVWRAATGVDAADRRPLGPIQLGARARNWQQNLESKIQSRTPSRWIDMLARIHPEIHNDPYAAVLAHRIAALHDAGVPVSEIVTAVVADGPLPAQQPAAALWWRLSRHLTPAEQSATLPNPAAIAPNAEGIPTEEPAGAHGARLVAAGPEHSALHCQKRDSQALQQPADLRWRDWGNQTDPALTCSEHWQAIASHLDRLDPAINIDRLSQRFRGSPADLILAILKDHNDPEPTDIRTATGAQQQATSTWSAAKMREHHHRRGPITINAPRR